MFGTLVHSCGTSALCNSIVCGSSHRRCICKLASMGSLLLLHDMGFCQIALDNLLSMWRSIISWLRPLLHQCQRIHIALGHPMDPKTLLQNSRTTCPSRCPISTRVAGFGFGLSVRQVLRQMSCHAIYRQLSLAIDTLPHAQHFLFMDLVVLLAFHKRSEYLEVRTCSSVWHLVMVSSFLPCSDSK